MRAPLGEGAGGASEYYLLRNVTLGPFVLQMGHVSMATRYLVVA